MLKTVLLIEDDQDTRDLMSEILAEEQYFVVAVPTAGAGIFAAGLLVFDVIITDLRMMDVDPDELVELLAEIPNKPPMLIVSACTTAEILRAKMRMGANDYLMKPFERSKFFAKLDSLTAYSKAARAA